MFKKKFAHICEAVAGTYPEAKFLYDSKDDVGVIFFHRSQILIQDAADEEHPDACHILCHKDSSPKFVLSITVFATKLFEQVTIGDNFVINEEGECISYVEKEDLPRKGESFH